jgi:hypothetical protein
MDAQSISTLHDLVAEDGRDIVYQQARMSCGLVDLRLPSEEKYRPKPSKQRFDKPITVKRMAKEVGTVQVKKGGIRAFGVTSDGATRRTGSAVQFNKGTYEFKVVEGELEIPLGLANVAAGGAGIDYVDEQLRSLGSQFGAHLDRAVAGTQLGAPASTASGTTITVTDPSGYIEGEEYDHYTAGDVYTQTFRVSNIAPPTTLSGNWTITTEDTLTSSILTTAKIYQSGGGSSTNRLTSLTDVCTSATQLYGLSTTNFPSGISMALSSWNNIDGRKMSDLIAVISGSRPTHIVTNSLGASKILNQSVAQRRFSSGEMDPYAGAVPKFDDLPIVVSEQLSGNTIRFINADKCFLHEFWPFQFQGDGVGSGGFGASVLKLSENNVSYKGLGTGGFEFVVKHRRAFGEFTSVGD